MAKVLIIESILATPHTETNAELGVLHSIAGDKVDYFPLYLFVGSYPWNSPIGGDPLKSREIIDWHRYILDRFKSIFSFISLDYIYDSVPSKVLEKINISLYSELNSRTLVSSISSGRENLDSFAVAKNSIERLTEYASKIIYTLLLTRRPDLIYAFNGRIPTLWPIYHIAKALDISVRYQERGATVDKYAISDIPFAYAGAWRKMISKYISETDEVYSRLNSAYFYAKQRKGSVLNFSYAQRHPENSNFTLPGLSDKYAVFFCSSETEINTVPEQDAYFAELPTQRDCVELLLDCCKQTSTQVVIKSHPSAVDGDDGLGIFHDGRRCIYIPPSSEISSYNLGERATFRFSVGSTISFELMNEGLECAFMAKCILYDHPLTILANDKASVLRYLTKKTYNPDATRHLARIAGDFYASFGIQYRFFKPSGLFSGEFSDLPN